MVSFRFHLTSIVALFLSLGLGLLIGVSLADDETIRSEQKALILSIERSLDRLRTENTNLLGELAHFQSALNYYDEVLGEAGKALLGERLAGRRVTLFVGASAESHGQELRRFLRSSGLDVSTVVWAGDEKTTSPPIADLAELLIGTGVATVLEPLIAGGELRFDGSLTPTDSVILLVSDPSDPALPMAQEMTHQPMLGLFASIGQLSDEFLRPFANAGWDVIHHIDTIAGWVRLATILANHFDDGPDPFREDQNE